jgi:exosome complex component RRP4
MEKSSLRFEDEEDAEMKSGEDQAHMKIVVPGDYIAEGAGLTAGHGTFEAKDEENEQANAKIYASVAGVVHKIDNWIGVKPLKTGYKPDVGDVVVGRVVGV